MGHRAQDEEYRCGDWPMTLERIRDWQRAFKGAPSRRVPFGAHAVKYLMYLLEQSSEGSIANNPETERILGGNTDPPDAPWIKRPRTGNEWRHRYDPKPPVIGENANPIPPGATPPDQGSDDYPELEQYYERTHEEGTTLTSQDRADEMQLRRLEQAGEASQREQEDMDLSHLDAPSDVAAKELTALARAEGEAPKRPEPEDGLGDFFS